MTRPVVGRGDRYQPSPHNGITVRWVPSRLRFGRSKSEEPLPSEVGTRVLVVISVYSSIIIITDVVSSSLVSKVKIRGLTQI